MRNGLKNKRRAIVVHQRLVIPVIVLVAIAAISIYGWRSLQSDSFTGANTKPAYWPTTGWHYSPPEVEGFDSVKLAQGLQAIQQNHVNIHSLTIVRNGEVFLDAYFYPYDGSTYHDMASVTKSITTTLIGIAVDQGKLKLDDPLLSFFPNRTVANRDALKESVTVRHLVSMSSGFSCTAIPKEITLEEMQASPDWVQFALDRPMAREPGKLFVYESPGMHLLSAILQQATGMTALEFARQNLFGPLGITDVCWPSDPQGYSRGGGDLCLHPNDAAKLGFLFLYNGQWGNRQIVSREWVGDATTKQIDTGQDYPEDYGYGWWISPEADEISFFAAEGRGTQRIVVIQSLNMVLVTTGAGFSLDDVTRHVEAAIVNLDRSLPANPAGVAQLDVAVKQCKQPPTAQPIQALPDMAYTISTKTFTFEKNPIQLRSIRLDFNESSEAELHLDLTTEEEPRVAGVGLDSVYRPSVSGRPSVAHGTWTDEQTFTIDYNEGPGLNQLTFKMRFYGDRMTFEIVGLGTLEGKLTFP